MPTDTAPVSPATRQDPRQVVNSLKKTVNYNDAAIVSGVAFDQALPMGAVITQVLVEILTAFNAATTNVFTVGTNSSTYNNIVAAGDVNEAAVGVTLVARALGEGLTAAADIVPFAMFTQSGTAATAGKARITINYEGGWAS